MSVRLGTGGDYRGGGEVDCALNGGWFGSVWIDAG